MATPKNTLDDRRFFEIATQLNNLTAAYQLPYGSPGHLKHHQYVCDYDKVLSNSGLTKAQFIAEVQRRAKEKAV
jgi:hypothetical protein